MIKVLIVEDKPLILHSIKDKIQSFNSEIEIIGEATNGEAALSMIFEFKPDIVFTDIRMPMMDGLKLISEVRKKDQELQFVIISGYDEFDYARQAMKLKVSDYLLKPVKQEEVNEVLKKAIKLITSKRLEQTKNILQDILYSNANTTNLFEGKLPFDRFYSLILNVGPYSNFILDYANPFNNYWSTKSIGDILSSRIEFSENYWLFEGKSFNELVLVLGLLNSSQTNINTIVDAIMSQLPDHDTPVTIVVSHEMRNVQDIGIETQFCRVLLRQNLILGKSNVFLRDKMKISPGEEFSFMDSSLEKRLISNLQNRQRELFLKEIARLFSTWEKNNYPQSTVERLLKQIIKLCQKAAIVKPSIYDTDLELEIDEMLSSFKEYSALLQEMTLIFGQFFSTHEKCEGKGDFNKTILKKVEDFLKTSFSDQITINDIATMVNLHPAYLSRIFKNAKGVSPMEYLTTLRIERAKEMILSAENLPIKEIAKIVGYTDPFYFSRIFKSVTGKSPSEFKIPNC